VPIRSTQPPYAVCLQVHDSPGGIDTKACSGGSGYKPSGYVVKESHTEARLPICAQGLKPPNITLSKIHTVRTIVAHESALSV
jgi:hypothetical protein